jgi:glucose/arabinose dehydrogenase
MNRRRPDTAARLAAIAARAVVVAALAGAQASAQSLIDPALRVEIVAQGLSQPTSMTFIGHLGEFLVAQKGDGRVLDYRPGSGGQTVLDVAVNSASERGLLGIVADPNFDFLTGRYIYVYYTESSTGADTSDPASTPLGNRVYRYTWSPGPPPVLQDPLLLLDLPATPGPNHDGGVLAFGPDDALYVVIGDLNRDGKLQNNPTGADPDDTGVILRVDTSGRALGDNPFFSASAPSDPMGRYFAYGVRNSFGLAFDPITGGLWDTENGPASYDEVNRVVRGFNSGWRAIMGPDARDPQGPGDLWSAPGSNYRDPEFSWAVPVAPTALAFVAGRRLGCGLEHALLAGDNNCGNLYRFTPNAARDGLIFSSDALLDRVADNAGATCSGEMSEILFGGGFGVITDIKNGPDGDLYLVSLSQGRVYRVVPNAGAFTDSDGDGVDDACDCGPAIPFVFAPPVEVSGLRLAWPYPGSTGVVTGLGWDPQNSITGSDTRATIASGDLGALHYDSGFSRACALGSNLLYPPFTDTRPEPIRGYGYYYLVREGNECGPGTYGDGTGTPDPRDALDAAAALTVCGLCTGRAPGAVVTLDISGESLAVWIANDAFIDTAKQLLATGKRMIPSFTLADGRDCDSQWTWHPDPLSVAWGDAAIEVCDGLPSDVEADKAYWFSIGFCPWTAVVTAVDDRR